MRVSFRKLLPCAIQSIHRVTGRNAMIVAGRWLSSSSSFSACCFKRHALHLVTFTCFTAVQPFFARSSSLSAGKEEEEEEKSGNNDYTEYIKSVTGALRVYSIALQSLCRAVVVLFFSFFAWQHFFSSSSPSSSPSSCSVLYFVCSGSTVRCHTILSSILYPARL